MELQERTLGEIHSPITDEYFKTDHYNINKPTAVLKSVAETTPRGTQNNYRPYWTEKLEAETNPSVENNIALKVASAKCRKAYNQPARSSWRDNTGKLKDSNKLWSLIGLLGGD